MRSSALNARRRAADLAAIAGETVDVLVVGGGATGTGVAVDAAARGLSVALVEARDLAFGTSRWSSKLIHGGLRYLAKGDVGLAAESAAERHVLLTRTAPHLTRALPQLVPLTPQVSPQAAALTYAGLTAGDGLRRLAGTPAAVLPRPRRVSAAEALALAPGLRRTGLRGGLLSFDGQVVDDARLVVALARTAAARGARILTRVRALMLDGQGAQLLDEVTGHEVRVRARAVVNATGVWAGELVDEVRLRPSRGSHLVLDGRGLGIGGTALTIPVPNRFGSFALLLPQSDGRVYLGLTDIPVDEITDVPAVPESDVDFLLGIASAALSRPLSKLDVLGSFAGLRPLLHNPGERTADLSRHHAVLTAANGVITVVGGKLTTYRKMAADAVDAAVRRAGLQAGRSTTRDLPLIGAAPRAHLTTLDAPDWLVSRHGTDAVRIHAMAQLDPDLAKPITPTSQITAAEVVWAVRTEGAMTADDVLDRRTRVGLVPAERAEAEPVVAELVARALDGLA
ncbi:glycerol-3-phosphate dehydrogenase/oxidase [Actinokineospora sp. NPDC004072]